MDPNHHILPQQQVQQPQPPTAVPTSNKRRKKAETGGDETGSSSEPRRLRRSHEACARCRSKKIKCDSKHPRCTACATAGTPCHQEDRHRQTLTPRGHTERIELQVAQCEALLKRHIPGFELVKLDEILAREGIEVVHPATATTNFQFQAAEIPTSFARTQASPGQGPPPMPPQPGMQPAMYYPHPHMMPPPPHGYPMMPYPPFHPMQMQPPPPGSYNPHMHPPFQPPPPGYMPPPPGHPGAPPTPQQQSPPPPQPHVSPPAGAQPQSLPPPVVTHVPPPIIAQTQSPALSAREQAAANKGQDPNGNDMSNTEALAKNFGVAPSIVSDLKLGTGAVDKEDLAVGSSGLSSGRDRDIGKPRNSNNWVRIYVRRNSGATAPAATLEIPTSVAAASQSVEVWLPKDREMVQHIVEGYFVRLNVHRPVFVRKDFEETLNDLYDGRIVSHDPGYVCSVYLVLALGTLSELNHRAVKADVERSGDVGHLGPTGARRFMPKDWPEHDEFFERALAVKPDLRVTVSSLQALILLHWYLYTERQGRTLWRLVGSLVRLAIELGLHHDPTTQVIPVPPGAQGTAGPPQKIFTEEECELRIRLWGIVLVHDRGTSILLGRPLGIAPSDSNTPPPIRPKDGRPADYSEHFEHSMGVADIQADIINSLYTPKKRQSADVIMRNATRIIKRMSDFRKSLPEKYNLYFTGTGDWPLDRRSKLVQEITEDEGLTLLKIGIARILLLRALFNSKELSYAQRHRALVDAIITSHNTIIVHNQLICFPDIAFFTSPIPLHIAAMVILYGHMSKCDTLPRQTALEDVWLALDMLPRFRWRWERKDVNGGHPLIAKLAERVMDVDLANIKPVSQPVLICEPHWDEDVSPVPKSQQTTPTLANTGYTNGNGGAVVYGPQPRMNGVNGSGNSSGGSTPPDGHLVDVPNQLFYPFYPETTAYNMPAPAANTNGHQRDYSQLLAVAAQDGSYGFQSSQDSYMSEERVGDTNHSAQQQGMVWVNAQGQRGPIQTYPVPPQT
ncbi:putative fungal specific transcription factor [Lyophyllum shimeji]|uniref:Fungal specific transcription factor n=1 Tax=Lyophyllum shimeji TaxID=47721 RepID=A0A9P3URW9_LYOSH|nr:putative fungal specific transcription factor [Lyophyllum shimeji]